MVVGRVAARKGPKTLMVSWGIRAGKKVRVATVEDVSLASTRNSIGHGDYSELARVACGSISLTESESA